jgi:Ku protein
MPWAERQSMAVLRQASSARGQTMAARATWKGFLRLGLVNIPIKVFSATESSGTIGFNELHAECQTRIQRKRWCPACAREVAYDELVKGYEFEAGRYVVVSGEDLAAVRPTSTRIIELVQFAEESTLDPMYVERTYYLAPDGKKPDVAFAVMREAMHGRIGIDTVAMHEREHLVAIRPKGRGLVMHTLYRADEMHTMDAVEDLNAVRDRWSMRICSRGCGVNCSAPKRSVTSRANSLARSIGCSMSARGVKLNFGPLGNKLLSGCSGSYGVLQDTCDHRRSRRACVSFR